MTKLSLPSVTLCAVTSVNLEATLAAMDRCLDQIDFGAVLLLSDLSPAHSRPEISVEKIEHLGSSAAYSHFMLGQLSQYIRTDHCLVVQWDGFVLDADNWDPSFLTFDYIGAPWPQFSDDHMVGNGGFSLRSRTLLEACTQPDFQISHPEDLAICRSNRALLEQRYGIRFADLATASRFSCERTGAVRTTFGFHGVFRAIPAIGADAFWHTYQSLDDATTVYHDYGTILRDLQQGRKSICRSIFFTFDYFVHQHIMRNPFWKWVRNRFNR